MRFSYFLICSLFVFLFYCPSFALDEEEFAASKIMLSFISKNQEEQRIKKSGEHPHKEIRAKVMKALDEIISSGRDKKTAEIIEALKIKVVGLKGDLQKDLSRKQLQKWIYRARSGSYEKPQKSKIQKTTKAPSVRKGNALTKKNKGGETPSYLSSTQTSTRFLSSIASQYKDRSDSINRSSLPQPFQDAARSIGLPPIRNSFSSTDHTLPPISSFFESLHPKRDDGFPPRTTLPPISSFYSLDSEYEEFSRLENKRGE